jgi:catechol 2,3-dioxygenase-like lactoylglutathione lyase family enzyme
VNAIGVAYVNVNCSDLDRSLPFYLSLGFSLAQPFPEAFYPRVGVGYGVGRHRLRGALLSLGEGQITQLDLVEWSEPRTPAAPVDLTRPGFQRIAIATRDFHADYTRLKTEGVEFLSEPMTVSENDPTPVFVCFRDPDGNVLELVPR